MSCDRFVVDSCVLGLVSCDLIRCVSVRFMLLLLSIRWLLMLMCVKVGLLLLFGVMLMSVRLVVLLLML